MGEGAYGEFKKLATVFYAGGPGLLVHPVWQTSNAYFVELSLRQEQGGLCGVFLCFLGGIRRTQHRRTGDRGGGEPETGPAASTAGAAAHGAPGETCGGSPGITDSA
ncbi:MAG: hypothetical protein ACLRIS_08780 [Flavonifractor plautii]